MVLMKVTESQHDKAVKSWIDLFMSNIKISNSCWIWQGSIISNGYGQFNSYLDTTLAHVFSYIVFCGELEDGFEVDHTCQNRACVAPIHLEAVTHSVNVQRSYFNRHNKKHQYDEFSGKTSFGRATTSIEGSDNITQEELIDHLKDEGYDVNIRTLRYWRSIGVIPEMERNGKQWYYSKSIINFIKILCINRGREHNGIIIEKELEGEKFKVYEIHVTKDRDNKDFMVKYTTNKGILINKTSDLNAIYG